MQKTLSFCAVLRSRLDNLLSNTQNMRKLCDKNGMEIGLLEFLTQKYIFILILI